MIHDSHASVIQKNTYEKNEKFSVLRFTISSLQLDGSFKLQLTLEVPAIH